MMEPDDGRNRSTRAMAFSLPKGFDRTNAIVGAVVWLTVLFVYNLTKAPTLTFWDCGEFIACSVTLGIPHPPGTPAFILVGRLASLFPLIEDVAARINFLSAFCSSIAALFAYLIAVRLMRPWFETGTAYARALIYSGAASGTLFLAFGLTQWGNSVEAEVYGMSMAILMAMVWLTMVSFEHRETPLADKLMLVVVYLGFFAIGVHLTTFLALPVCAMVFILRKDAPRWTWFVLAAWVVAELVLLLILCSRPGELPFWLPVLLAFVLYVFYVLSFEKVPRELLFAGGAFAVACAPVLGVFTEISATLLTTLSIIAIAAITVYASYCALVWWRGRRNRQTGHGQHLLVLALFVFATDVCIGLILSHVRGYFWFMALTAVLAFVAVAAIGRHLRWPVLVALVGCSLIVVGVHEWLFGSLAALVLIAFLGLVWRADNWRSAVLIVVFAALGFSVFAVLPIRSSMHPGINENNPSQSLKATIDSIERRQYGSQSMIDRMFERRGAWENQLGTHVRMGFWGFFREQYGITGTRFLILLVLGALGLWEACRRKPEFGTVVLVLLLLSTVGLILYMNFADGTRQTPTTAGDYLEVRDRDYFFTPGFMLFGLMIGVGLTAFAQYVREMVRGFARIPRSAILASVLVVFLLPVYTVRANYFMCDRSRNYLAFDYAYDILMSADPNAVLFTAGDNDTFPLWAVQDAYGIRKDVRNINLSLANLDWYIKQIRDSKGLAIGWTDAQVDSLRPFRLDDGRTFRIQDQVIDAVVRNNWGRVPINFSYTVPSSSRRLAGRGADSLLEMHAMAYRLTDSVLGLRVDAEHSVKLATEVFRYRGWNDQTIYRDLLSLRQTGNVAACLMEVAEALVGANKRTEAEQLLSFVSEKIEYAQPAAERLASLYADRGAIAELTRLKASRSDLDSLQITTLIGRAYRGANRNDSADTILSGLLDRHPSYRPALNELMAMYISAHEVVKVEARLQKWVTDNPQDAEIREALNQLRQQVRRMDAPATGGDSR